MSFKIPLHPEHTVSLQRDFKATTGSVTGEIDANPRWCGYPTCSTAAARSYRWDICRTNNLLIIKTIYTIPFSFQWREKYKQNALVSCRFKNSQRIKVEVNYLPEKKNHWKQKNPETTLWSFLGETSPSDPWFCNHRQKFQTYRCTWD